MIRVAVLLPVNFERGGEFLADVAALEAAGAYAELVDGSGSVAQVVMGAIAAVTHNVKVGCLSDEAVPDDGMAIIDRISGGRAIVISPDEWIRIEMPADRSAWRDALARHEAAGASGLIVQWDPRLIDLLRNPDADDDRSDLAMSTG